MVTHKMADMKKIEYTSSRLCFKATEIEPLQDTDVFIIRTPQGGAIYKS